MRGELLSDVWRCLGGLVVVLGVNFGVSTAGVFGVWIGTEVSDHGTRVGSGFCSAVAAGFVRHQVCSIAVSVRRLESEVEWSWVFYTEVFRPWKWKWVSYRGYVSLLFRGLQTSWPSKRLLAWSHKMVTEARRMVYQGR